MTVGAMKSSSTPRTTLYRRGLSLRQSMSFSFLLLCIALDGLVYIPPFLFFHVYVSICRRMPVGRSSVSFEWNPG